MRVTKSVRTLTRTHTCERNGADLSSYNSLCSMPTSQLSCVVRPFENSSVLDQCQLFCVVRPFENAKVLDQCQLLCVVRPFEISILSDQCQLPCVVQPFENSIVFGQYPQPNCLVWSDPSKIQ